jgi:hypothetical protein|tara:strand:- start:748 stop:1128 length:381 start_codon:yes stop_codon:yes gene_type:complete
MKNFVATSVALLLTTTAVSAADLGMGFSAGGEIVSEYTYDAENMNVTLTPEVGYTLALGRDIDFTMSTDLELYDDEFVATDMFDSVTLDLEASMMLMNSLEAYTKTSYDIEDGTRGEISMGLSFSF